MDTTITEALKDIRIVAAWLQKFEADGAANGVALSDQLHDGGNAIVALRDRIVREAATVAVETNYCDGCDDPADLARTLGDILGEVRDEGDSVDTVDELIATNAADVRPWPPSLARDWRCPTCSVDGHRAVLGFPPAVMCRNGHESS